MFTGIRRLLCLLGLALLLVGPAPLSAQTIFGQGASSTPAPDEDPVSRVHSAEPEARGDELPARQLRLATRAELTHEQDSRGVYLWKFVAYLEGPKLASVREVTYILHPSYQPDRFRVTGGQGFAMSAWAYTGFRLGAEVTLRDGSKQTLWHEMELLGEDYPSLDFRTVVVRQHAVLCFRS